MEPAAAAVPEAQRPRVLGQLLARAAPDDQVRAVIGFLLLAKTLIDLGWQVEHEPELGGLTPELRITRDGTTYLVEVQRIIYGRDEKAERMLLQVRDSLAGLRTRTPLNLEAVYVPGLALGGYRPREDGARWGLLPAREGREVRSGEDGGGGTDRGPGTSSKILGDLAYWMGRLDRPSFRIPTIYEGL